VLFAVSFDCMSKGVSLMPEEIARGGRLSNTGLSGVRRPQGKRSYSGCDGGFMIAGVKWASAVHKHIYGLIPDSS